MLGGKAAERGEVEPATVPSDGVGAEVEVPEYLHDATIQPQLDVRDERGSRAGSPGGPRQDERDAAPRPTHPYRLVSRKSSRGRDGEPRRGGVRGDGRREMCGS